MNKPRHPLTFAAAATRALGILGGPEAARAIGKSESLVRKAADPDVDFDLNIAQCAALDLACLAVTSAEGRPETPFLTVFGALVARAPGQEAGVAELLHRVAVVTGETGDLARTVDQAARDGAISANERVRIAEAAQRQIKAAQDVLDAVSASARLRAVDGKGGVA